MYTELWCCVCFPRKTYNSLTEVEDDLKDCEAIITLTEKRLLSLACMTEPLKFFPTSEDPLDEIRAEVARCMDALEESYAEKFDLLRLIDNWSECHDKDGLAIPPPKEWTDRTAFMDGDFVNTTDCPDDATRIREINTGEQHNA